MTQIYAPDAAETRSETTALSFVTQALFPSDPLATGNGSRQRRDGTQENRPGDEPGADHYHHGSGEDPESHPTGVIAGRVHVVEVIHCSGRQDERDVHDDEGDVIEHDRQVDRAGYLHGVNLIELFSVLRPCPGHPQARDQRQGSGDEDGYEVGQQLQAVVIDPAVLDRPVPVSYTHLRAHETDSYLVCRLL